MHDVQEKVVHARLVEHEVGKLRKTILGVLNSAASDDVFALGIVRFPERRFIDPIAFFEDAFAEAVGLEHLDAAARDAVGLPELKRTRFLLDQRDRDVGERR